jgi:hypothetical protein
MKLGANLLGRLIQNLVRSELKKKNYPNLSS